MAELLLPWEVQLDDDFASLHRAHKRLCALRRGRGRANEFDCDDPGPSIVHVPINNILRHFHPPSDDDVLR